MRKSSVSAVGTSSTSATKVDRCWRMNSSHSENSASTARSSVCSALDVPRWWCQASGMVITRSKDSQSTPARRAWAMRSAPRATRTKAMMLKAPSPAHKASVGTRSRLSEMASMMRPNRTGSAIVTMARMMFAPQMKATRLLVCTEIPERPPVNFEQGHAITSSCKNCAVHHRRCRTCCRVALQCAPTGSVPDCRTTNGNRA